MQSSTYKAGSFASMTVMLLLLTIVSNAQFNYFAGTNAGAGNTGTYVTGIGYNAVANANRGTGITGYGAFSLRDNTTGNYNTGIGYGALLVNTTGINNTSVGGFSLYTNITGGQNTATGFEALRLNSSGSFNTAFGAYALRSNSTASNNSAFGNAALRFNTTGTSNNAFGSQALNTNTTGNANNAFGLQGLYLNTTGSNNNTFGALSLRSNTTGQFNNAFGSEALYTNSTGVANNAFGYLALNRNTTGSNNQAFGREALFFNTTGSDNIAFGQRSLYNSNNGSVNIAIGTGSLANAASPSSNIAIGQGVLSSSVNARANVIIGNSNLNGLATSLGNTAVGHGAMADALGVAMQNEFNTALGYFALGALGDYKRTIGIGYFTGIGNGFASKLESCVLIGDSIVVTVPAGAVNAISIGSNAVVDASNKVRIGNAAITSIGGQVGWTTYSDRRLKSNISKSKLGLDFILSLNPVTYNYTAEVQKGILYNGLIAQEVDEAAKKAGIEFSGVDKTGEHWGIRYGDLTVPLIKGMQEMNDKISAENYELKSRIEKLEATLLQLQQTGVISTASNSSALFQNQPNPFNASTEIKFALAPSVKKATIIIRNISGELVKQIDNVQAQGNNLTIRANEMAAGTYTYSLIINGNVVDTKLMVLTR